MATAMIPRIVRMSVPQGFISDGLAVLCELRNTLQHSLGSVEGICYVVRQHISKQRTAFEEYDQMATYQYAYVMKNLTKTYPGGKKSCAVSRYSSSPMPRSAYWATMVPVNPRS